MRWMTIVMVCGLAFPPMVMAQPVEGAPISASEPVDAIIKLLAVDDADAVRRYDVLMALSTHHSNERHRLFAQVAANNRRWTDAEKHFRIASTFADKYSQHRLSVMYWYGLGVPQDRIQAYVWADIAAERGYPQFLVVREWMWKSLTPEQQAATTQSGTAMYAQYGDVAAKERFAKALQLSAKRWRAKQIGGIAAILPGKSKYGESATVEESLAWGQAYAPENVQPDLYWAKEDRIMMIKGGRTAEVEVGEIQDVILFKLKPKTKPATQPKDENP